MATTKITTNVIADDAITSDQLGGDLTMPGHVSLADNKEIRVGTGNDLVIKHSGSHTTLTNTTGNLVLAGDAVYIANGANSEYLAQFIANGAASLRYNDTEELATVSGGVYVPNKLGIGTNSPARELHVSKASSGATSTSNSVLVVEDDDNTELSILGGSSSVLAINFGHSGDADEGKITFNTTAGSEDLQLVSSKEITLDAAGDITLDADGGNIVLKDGGTQFGDIYTSSNHLYIKSTVSDANIYFEGNDGGTPIGAFTLDMSEGGAATFNAKVIAPNGATSGYYLKQTGGTATPRVTNDGNEWTILRPGASGADVAINNYANSANRVIFRDEGNVEIVDGNLVVASGHGIDFSATGSGTSTSGNAHILDEYEYGSWTPTCNTGSATFVSPYYVKIGRIVHFSFQVHQFSDVTTASSIDLRGLPFPCVEGQAAGTVFGIYLDHEVDSVYVNTAEEIFFYELTNSGWYAARHSDLNSSSAYFYVGGSYISTG